MDEWEYVKEGLVAEILSLGFPMELGEAIAQHLASPKAIDRMAAYLWYERPTSDVMIVDEMLAIRAEIDAWQEKKKSQEASGAHNDMLWHGLL